MSNELFERAKKHIPGGVNSPVRAFKSVGGSPVFIAKAKGPYIYDTKGKEYVDFVGSWGPMILGHAYPTVVEAVQIAAGKGLSFGACTEAETELAEKICSLLPSMEMVRLVNSGTEATMSAVRLARGFTGRPKIIKFRGCYHGHADSFLIAAGSGAKTFGTPSSPGVTPGSAQDTLLCEYNDLLGVENLFNENQDSIACVIVEPIAGNMGVVPPAPGFLQGLRNVCTKYNALLIFDEVMTGFRVGLQGAQGRYAVQPDLTTLGKIVGGGMPLGAYGGKKEILAMLSPSGPVYQAGTLSGNPLATAAGLATLAEIEKSGFYEALEKSAQIWESDLRNAFNSSGTPITINRVGSMLTAFFTTKPVTDDPSASLSDVGAYAKFFQAMLNQGVYLAPSQFEAAFLSAAHTPEVMDRVNQALKVVL